MIKGQRGKRVQVICKRVKYWSKESKTREGSYDERGLRIRKKGHQWPENSSDAENIIRVGIAEQAIWKQMTLQSNGLFAE